SAWTGVGAGSRGVASLFRSSAGRAGADWTGWRAGTGCGSFSPAGPAVSATRFSGLGWGAARWMFGGIDGDRVLSTRTDSLTSFDRPLPVTSILKTTSLVA